MINTTMKRRASVNAERPLTKNEAILKECYQIYTDSENGLVRIASNLGLNLLPPRKKITIMLIGNHSAGKSSFINWYIEEHVQKTGVAIETQGFALVTSGKKRETLTGNATLHLFPHFKPLIEYPCLLNCLTTEVSTSKQKKFPLITFVDTPGLVDGDMKYPFDVNHAILWMGNVADLIFVFFDPIGQALCKRTLNIVEELNKGYPGKIRFCLSKADEAGHESDRQRVMMQIVQEVCKRPGLNGTCFDMPTIFIPGVSKPVRCVNQIEDVCKDIEKTIEQTVQTTLNQLEKDCDKIKTMMNEAIERDDQSRRNNNIDLLKGSGLIIVSCLIHLLFFIDIILYGLSDEKINYLLGGYLLDYLHILRFPFQRMRESIPEKNMAISLTSCVGFSVFIFVFIAKILARAQRPTLTKRRKKLLIEQQEYVVRYVNVVKQKLYKEYLEQTISEHDL